MPSFAVFAVESARRGALEAVARREGTLIDGAGDRDALRRLLERRLIDIVLAAGIDAETLASLTVRHPATRFILLAEDSEALDLVLAGGAAVLPREAGAAAIASAVVAMGSGLRLIPDLALDRLRALAGVQPVATEDEMPVLTPREHEVLAAMADGASNKVIARRLGISFHTAKFHIASILAKLDADTRTEALARAARMGLVML
ncbi:MAG TPA: response regulator transcription factor [Stellaceae bacterium]|jgi:DNA-binding NarL/FixJ family response regulator